MTTPAWTPTSQYLTQPEPSVWERIKAKYWEAFVSMKAPDGYRFRMLPNGEPEYREVADESDVWLCPSGTACFYSDGPVHHGKSHANCGAVLILSPIPEPNPKEYVIRLRETGEVRQVRTGEYFLKFGKPMCWVPLCVTTNSHPILRVVSREAVKL